MDGSFFFFTFELKYIIMKQKILYISFFFLTAYVIAKASGGGGGGSCGKNGCGGNNGGNSENSWVNSTLGGWYTIQGPSEIVGPCSYNLLGNGGGNNTYPVLTPQFLGSHEYLSQILVQDLVTNEIRQQEYFPGASSMPIVIPRNHAFRINFTHYDPCSQCMSALVPLTSGEGRRVIWNTITEYPAGNTYFVNGFPGIYSGLTSCN